MRHPLPLVFLSLHELGRENAELVLGLTQGLDTQFDYVEAARPYIDRLVASTMESRYELVLDEAKSIGKTLLALPRQTQEILTKLERGELRVKVDMSDLVRSVDRSNIGRSLRTMVVVMSALVAGGVVLYIYNRLYEAGCMGGFGLLLLVVLVFWMRRAGRSRPGFP